MRYALLTMLLMLPLALRTAPAQQQPASQPHPAPGLEPAKERVIRDVLEKREQMRTGRVVRTNVRVTVRLKNGNKLIGVVKNENFIERLDVLDFVPTSVEVPGAGLRIWYTDNTNSYIFLTYEEIVGYRIHNQLTDVQVKAIEERIDRDKRTADEQRAAAARRKQEEAARAGDAPAATPAPAPGENAEQAALLKLLQEFPPEEGWGEERARQIEVRKITLGVYPDERSKRFLDVYPEWTRALKTRDEQKKAREKEQSEKGGDAPATGDQKPAHPEGQLEKAPEPKPSRRDG